jgi:ADP-heptose:LPS heptosyltransferase/GT2 family glycosyltransferase
MTTLFRAYELLATSELFDAEYYLENNPDIAALNVDPVLHYLESGAGRVLNPSARFDSAYYLEQCLRHGEATTNPLLHYITIGAARGLKPRRESSAAEPLAVQSLAGGFAISVDRAVVMRGANGSSRLAIEGWAVAQTALTRILVMCNDVPLGEARIGIARPDVAQAFPQLAQAASAGFYIDADCALPAGADALTLTVSLVTASGAEYRQALAVEVDSTPASANLAAVPTRTVRARAAGQPPPMHIEIDEATVDHAGILTVSGWAVCCLDITAVSVSVDGEMLGTADFGRRREDVALARKEFPRALNSGFAFNADLSRFGAGERAVKVEALAQSGIRRHALVQVMIPEPSVPLGEPLFQFHCDAVSLSTAGAVAVDGWLIGATTTESLTVRLDGIEIGRARIGGERLDVGREYPGIAYARNSGFTFRRAPGSAVAPGEHQLMLVAQDAAGHVREIPVPVWAAELSPDGDRSAAASEASDAVTLSIDAPRISNGRADTPIISSLSINGWALARAGVAQVSIEIDGKPVANAQHGIRRADVANAFPDREDAQHSGFATLIPYWLLPKGSHSVCLTVRDKQGQVAAVQFGIEVEEIPEGEGPWSLRRKMSQAEIDLHLSVLSGVGFRPAFAVVVACDGDEASLAGVTRTLRSLENQVYGEWTVWLAARDAKALGKRWRMALLAGFPELEARVKFSTPRDGLSFARDGAGPGSAEAAFVLPLRGGDELGCDALLELALAAGLERGRDVFYGDERCHSAVTNSVQAYFKPGWSPDLLLSTNYVGRPWCARSTMLERAGVNVREWLELGDYEVVLRATEAAAGVGHVPKVLAQRGAAEGDTDALERAALARALTRRNISGSIKKGCRRGFYRIKPAKAKYGRVSIIIPTRASRGLIKVCLETLKAKTAYRDYEIICIENIPPEEAHWKRWLRENADVVLETDEPFNWSRYNNRCAEKATGNFLLFLNDDIEILDKDWLDTLLHTAARPEVGIVGPQLLYPDGTVQHAGLALTNVMGRARHIFRHGREDDPGYFGLALTQRNVIAVTGACMLMRRDTFDALKGFDEAYNVINNDLDFCLRAWRRGLSIVYTPHARLTHHEMVSRTALGDAFDSAAFIREWQDVFVEGDPYLNRNLSRESDDLVPEREPVTAICAGYPLFARSAIRRILVLKLDHIGDCITSLPAIRKLKRHFPSARLTVLTGSATRLVWSMEAAVDRVLEFNFFHARSQLGTVGVSEQELEDLAEQLSPLRFDLAVDLRKSLDTRHVLKHTGAKYLAGYDYQDQFPWLDVALQWEGDPGRISKRQSIGDDLVRLVDAIGSSCENERKLLDRKVKPLNLTAEDAHGLFDRPLVCIHAGAGNELKAWPQSSFCELIDLLVEREGVDVVMVGGPAEAGLSDEVIAGVRDPSRIRNLAGKLSLSALPDLFLRARLFVGNDSGPKHIAAALGVPTVGIHSGNIDAREWGPVGLNAAAIWRQTSCSPCYIDKAEYCPRQLACLKGVGAGDVFRLCRKLLQVGSTPSAQARPSSRGKGRARSEPALPRSIAKRATA